MTPRRLPDGRIADVPAVGGQADNVIAEGLTTLDPDHPDYATWDRWLRLIEERERT